MARIDFFLGRSDELIEQVVSLYTESLAAADFNIGSGLVLLAERVAEFGGAARGKRDHLVRKMRVVIGGFVMAEAAQRFDDGILRLGLARVDGVVDLGDIARVGMIPVAPH